MLLSSFGLSLVMRGILFIVAGAETRRYDIDRFAVHHIGGLRLSSSQLIAILAGLISVAFVAYLLARTRIGKQMRALSDDQDLAGVAGVNVDRLITFTWMLSGALAAVAGVLEGLIQSSFDANMGSNLLLPVFAAVILGGLGSAYGALAGGLLLGVVMQMSTWSVLGGGLSPAWENVIAFAALVIMLIVRPRGLIGEARMAT
jgi:branched-subunit amino acid ABC-type transport system permease component